MAELEQVYVKQFSANCYTMAQQRKSRLQVHCTKENLKGESGFIDRVHPTHAQRSTGKYDKSPVIPTNYSRRMLRSFEYVWGDMVDWQDDYKILLDPTGKCTQAGAYALARTMDDIIIANAIFGSAWEGKDGTTEVPFPDAQKVSVTAGSTGNTGLNLEKLIQARSLIGRSDIDLEEPGTECFFVYTQLQLDDLLHTTEIKSADYNVVKALYEGTVNKYMGFTFIKMHTDRIPAESNVRKCFAFVNRNLCYCEPVPVTGHISERADYNYNWYSHMKMSFGATRYQDEGVVWCPCAES